MKTINVDSIKLGDNPSQTAPLCNGSVQELIDEIKRLRRTVKSKGIIFTKSELDAVRFAVGNFTGGDYLDCGGDKRLYTALVKAEEKL